MYFFAIFWCGGVGFLLGFLRKRGAGCGGFVVSSWRKVWQTWLADVQLPGSRKSALQATLFIHRF
jgi:hypothetical protein